ncbi:MAG: hypothetical protein AB1689_07205 [Thermodesulfobacteriota bacterium]
MKSWIRTTLAVAAFAVASVALPATGLAGPRRLQPPPDVDLDPERGMSFGRLPRTSFDQRVFSPLKQSLGSKAMDPAIDPYNPVVRPSRYEPGTGKIRDSLTDKVREMRRAEEARRPHRASWAQKDDTSSSDARRSGSVSRGRTASGSTKKSDD